MIATTPLTVPALRAEFDGGRRYLAACTVGLPPRDTRRAVTADVTAASRGAVDLAVYEDAVDRSRRAFAALVGVAPACVAIGAQASALAALVATGVPDGGEVLVPAGEFSSVVLPFVHAGRGIRVRQAPLSDLASAIGPATSLVVFSLVQSATGEVADLSAIAEAAARCGARTFCDATQAVGWLPVEAARVDALVCHAYKWLCAPRGVAFLTLTPSFASRLRPLHAGWYAGQDPWASCYGGDGRLAEDARRFDVSPAWQAFVGAAPALEMFARTDAAALATAVTGLADAFRARLGLPAPARASAIVTWADPEGDALSRLAAAGITASGRAGRARVAFHVFNDPDDVDEAARVLGR